MEKLLEVRDLRVSYSSHEAVRGVSFDVGTGEIVGLMGESGCGKTSIAMALLGLLSEKHTKISGSVLFRGQEILAMDECALREIRGARISMVFQEPAISLNPVRCVGDQVAEVIHAHKDWSWTRCRAEAQSVLNRVGLCGTRSFFRTYPHQLSGGQRQRVALAQALACSPSLVIADEPTSSLDACSQADFLGLLKQLSKEANLAVLLISHSLEVQASLASKLLVMADGRIIERGIFPSLHEHAAEPRTRTALRVRTEARHVEGREDETPNEMEWVPRLQ
jgi:ABC-type glutathione transport system ATPase component